MKEKIFRITYINHDRESKDWGKRHHEFIVTDNLDIKVYLLDDLEREANQWQGVGSDKLAITWAKKELERIKKERTNDQT